MHRGEGDDVAGGVSDPTSCSSTSASNALFLRTIQDQQDIIERQKELVTTLKKRVEELEAHQQTRESQPATATTLQAPQNGPASAAYAADVHQRRRVAAAEAETSTLRTQVAELQAELTAVSEQLEGQQLHHQHHEAAWQERVEAATAKATTAAQLLEALDRQNGRLTVQLEKTRCEAEARHYESTQWRALATTIALRLDAAHSRYARDQIEVIEEAVRRYATRRASAAATAMTSASASDDAGEAAADAASRHLWSRSAQAAQSSAAPPSRFLTKMNGGAGEGSLHASASAADADQRDAVRTASWADARLPSLPIPRDSSAHNGHSLSSQVRTESRSARSRA